MHKIVKKQYKYQILLQDEKDKQGPGGDGEGKVGGRVHVFLLKYG